ncbi:MAG: hypothetical protein IJV41_11790 [Oscillospiraceae bacterium]|nr:hypothetical protein [Oscillospiraceae bacterium]
MLSLLHPYIFISSGAGKSYGGAQQSSSNAMVSKVGCGIIAATDTLLYLSRYHMGQAIEPFRQMQRSPSLSSDTYDACILDMRRHYFPLIPYAGINGLMLSTGMNRFFRDHRMPFKARWSVSGANMWDKIEKMLRADIPVIMSVGPNFPFFWRNERACFYVYRQEEGYIPSVSTKAHYFTVTGMDERWLRVSSWGRLYFLNRQEFEHYVRYHSTAILSNILWIEKR